MGPSFIHIPSDDNSDDTNEDLVVVAEIVECVCRDNVDESQEGGVGEHLQVDYIQFVDVPLDHLPNLSRVAARAGCVASIQGEDSLETFF